MQLGAEIGRKSELVWQPQLLVAGSFQRELQSVGELGQTLLSNLYDVGRSLQRDLDISINKLELLHLNEFSVHLGSND